MSVNTRSLHALLLMSVFSMPAMAQPVTPTAAVAGVVVPAASLPAPMPAPTMAPVAAAPIVAPAVMPSGAVAASVAPVVVPATIPATIPAVAPATMVPAAAPAIGSAVVTPVPVVAQPAPAEPVAALATPVEPAGAMPGVDASGQPSLPSPTLAIDQSAKAMPGQVLGLSDAMLACQRRSDPKDRLQCYDAATPSLVGIGQATDNNVGAWVIGKDSAAVAATSVDSTEPRFDKGRAALYVKCREHQQEVYFSLATHAFDQGATHANVAVVIDGANTALRTAPWVPSQSGGAVGLWNTQDSAELIKQLGHAQRVSIRLDLSDSKFAIALFEVKGGDVVLAPLMAACVQH